MIKATYDKPMADIILNSEKLKALPLRSGTGPGCLLSTLLFNAVLDILATATRPDKKHKASKLERKK